jgi:serine/threonine protein kinase
MPGTVRPSAGPASGPPASGAPVSSSLSERRLSGTENLDASGISALRAPSLPNVTTDSGSSAHGLHVAHAITSYAGLTPSPSGALPPVSVRSAAPSDIAKVCPTCGLHYPAEFKVCPRDATELDESAVDADRDELVGKILSESYTIVRVIGEGGMGRVYEARHTRISGKRFAVKLLHPQYARQPEVLSRFQREAEAAASLRSPHVIDVYDVDRTADGRPFIVSEYLEGKEFASYLEAAGQMPTGPAVRIVRQICKALMAAHANGVVHRDMKPENVFLTGDLEQPIAKVIDFGISKVGDAPGTALTKTGMIMGTPSYMAPEQARGERVDHRADIYAVGAILYCALTGQRPFDRDDPTATLTAVLTQDPPRPRSIAPSIPAQLELILQRAMAKDPRDRQQSMEELYAELAPFDPGETDLSLAPSPGSEASLAPVRRSILQDPRARAADMARPMIFLLGFLGVFASASALMTMVTGVVRLTRGGGATANLTGSEAIFLFGGLLVGALTPLILAVRHVRSSVWGNSVKAMHLSERIYRPVVAGLCGYGFASLFIRVIEGVVLRRAVAVAWPVWDLILFSITLAAALGAYALHSGELHKD